MWSMISRSRRSIAPTVRVGWRASAMFRSCARARGGKNKATASAARAIKGGVKTLSVIKGRDEALQRRAAARSDREGRGEAVRRVLYTTGGPARNPAPPKLAAAPLTRAPRAASLSTRALRRAMIRVALPAIRKDTEETQMLSRRKLFLLPALLVAMAALTACPSQTNIGKITADPDRYMDKEVGVVGRVTDSYGVPFVGGAYELDDGTGKMWVVTQRGVPSKGSRVGVKG